MDNFVFGISVLILIRLIGVIVTAEFYLHDRDRRYLQIALGWGFYSLSAALGLISYLSEESLYDFLYPLLAAEAVFIITSGAVRFFRNISRLVIGVTAGIVLVFLTAMYALGYQQEAIRTAALVQTLNLFSFSLAGLIRQKEYWKIGGNSYHWLLGLFTAGTGQALAYALFAVPPQSPYMIMLTILVSTLSMIFFTHLRNTLAYNKLMERESEIRKLNTELESRVQERTARLASINRELESFTYSISHDLKAPLRGIDGYLGFFIADYGGQLDADGKHLLDQARNATASMNNMIDDLLIYSRVERQPIEQVEVILKTIIDELLSEKSSDITALQTQVKVNIPFVSMNCDMEGLKLSLRNLIDNAIKFSRNSRPPEIEIGGRMDPGKQILWVRDNGVGFDIKFQDRAFELFQRLHSANEFPGTGIGLAIVRKAMDRMGGRVYAESTPGQGAAFYLEFPAATKRTQQ